MREIQPRREQGEHDGGRLVPNGVQCVSTMSAFSFAHIISHTRPRLQATAQAALAFARARALCNSCSMLSEAPCIPSQCARLHCTTQVPARTLIGRFHSGISSQPYLTCRSVFGLYLLVSRCALSNPIVTSIYCEPARCAMRSGEHAPATAGWAYLLPGGKSGLSLL